jgi:hypothetical protein
MKRSEDMGRMDIVEMVRKFRDGMDMLQQLLLLSSG